MNGLHLFLPNPSKTLSHESLSLTLSSLPIQIPSVPMPLIRTTPPLPCAVSTLTNAPPSSSSTLSAATFGSHLLRKIQNPVFGFSATRNRSRAAVIRAKAGADYYSTLNVSPGASLQEIKASYRKLARKVPTFSPVCVPILMGRVWFWGNWSKLG